MGETNCKWNNWQRISVQNTQVAHTVQHQKNSPIKKWAKDLNIHFSKDRQTDGQQTHEKMLTSLIIRQMQIKTTMRYCLTLVRMAIIKKSTNNKCWEGCGEKGTLLHCWGDVTDTVTVETHVLQCSLQHYLRHRGHGNSLDDQQQMNG